MASQEEPTAGTPSTGTPSPTPSTSQTSCWECSRRRLVCDAARPTCAKCRAAGIVCPGYSNVKPLRWLAPGMVTTRVRRKTKRKTASGSTKTTHRTSPSDATDSSYSDSSGSPEGGPSALVPLNKGGGAKRQDSELVHQPSVRLAWGLPRGIPRAEFRFEETTDILQATYYCTSAPPSPILFALYLISAKANKKYHGRQLRGLPRVHPPPALPNSLRPAPPPQDGSPHPARHEPHPRVCRAAAQDVPRGRQLWAQGQSRAGDAVKVLPPPRAGHFGDG